MDSDVEEDEIEQRAFLTFTREYRIQSASAAQLPVHSPQPQPLRSALPTQRNNSSVESASTSMLTKRSTSGDSSRVQRFRSTPLATDRKPKTSEAAVSRVLDRLAAERPRVLVEDLLVSPHCTTHSPTHPRIHSFFTCAHSLVLVHSSR